MGAPSGEVCERITYSSLLEYASSGRWPDFFSRAVYVEVLGKSRRAGVKNSLFSTDKSRIIHFVNMTDVSCLYFISRETFIICIFILLGSGYFYSEQ